MNKQGKDKIEWCDKSWNPVTGCLHGCEYCYAIGIAKRFGGWEFTPGMLRMNIADDNTFIAPIKSYYGEAIATKFGTIAEITDPFLTERGTKAPFPFGFTPTLHKYRLNEPAKIKRPQKIFVCSMADLFGEWVPDSWIEEVYKACESAPQHTYMFLTKNPKKMTDSVSHLVINHSWFGGTPCVWWFGTTITCQDDIDRIGELPADTNNFVSVEPLLDSVDFGNSIVWVKWIIIGQQTGPGAKPPKPEWVQSIIDQCRAAGVPVFVKSPLYQQFPIQEWPKELE
jgi:protein gp37